MIRPAVMARASSRNGRTGTSASMAKEAASTSPAMVIGVAARARDGYRFRERPFARFVPDAPGEEDDDRDRRDPPQVAHGLVDRLRHQGGVAGDERLGARQPSVPQQRGQTAAQLGQVVDCGSAQGVRTEYDEVARGRRCRTALPRRRPRRAGRPGPPPPPRPVGARAPAAGGPALGAGRPRPRPPRRSPSARARRARTPGRRRRKPHERRRSRGDPEPAGCRGRAARGRRPRARAPLP